MCKKNYYYYILVRIDQINWMINILIEWNSSTPRWHCSTFYIIAVQPFKFIWSNWMPLAGAMTFKSTADLQFIFFSLAFVRYIFIQFEWCNLRVSLQNVPNVLFAYFFSAPSLMVSISSTVLFFTNVIVIVLNIPRILTMWTICKLPVHSQWQTFPINRHNNKTKKKRNEKKIIENRCA